MMMLSKVMEDNLKYILSFDCIDWNLLKDKTVFVTGATGLIGSTLINALLYKGDIDVIALVRDKEKAKTCFIKSDRLNIVVGDIENIPPIDKKIDYIVHGASPTQSGYFVQRPVETMKANIVGTINTLELAKVKNVTSYIYLSSMEAYGSNISDEPLREDKESLISSFEVRNSYPISKIASENLCIDYYHEYNVSAKIVRLAQTFGPGVKYDDTRVFAEFARCAINNKDIILKTKGETKRSYCHVSDAVRGVLTALLNGNNGRLYNIVNSNTFCSIKEMADIVAKDVAGGSIAVKVAEDETATKVFMKPHSYNLDSRLMNSIGFRAEKGLREMYLDMIDEMKNTLFAS